MSPENKAIGEVTRSWAGRAQWFHRIRRVRDSRGMALIMTLFVVFTLGMMIFAFAFMMQGEASFAALNRNASVALGLAEAGAQEAVYRLGTFGKGPGVSSFQNSLANSPQSPGSTGTVTYQASLQNNPQIFPVMSTATFGGTTRTVRIFEQALYKPGSGNIVFGPQVTFGGDAHQITGDSYAVTFVHYQQFQKAPQCATGANPTTLISPQVFAGTYVGAGSGPNQTTPCGDTNAANQYNFECQSAPNEVAPTPCPGGRAVDTGTGYTLPQNWHPQTPIGMDKTYFAAAATWINTHSQAGLWGLTLHNAQQNGTDVPYNQASYVPSYWASIAGSSNKVLLITAQQPFCVAPTNLTDLVDLPNPLGSTNCQVGGRLYGSSGQPSRFLDWGLVQDDLSRSTPQTFFQAPACTAPCANPGKQNGVRYIPLVPTIDVRSRACVQNANPGFNVFDQVNTADGWPACPNPPIQTIHSTSVTFSGTYTSPPGPEGLVIDNAGLPGCPGGAGCVSISPSINGPGSCSSNFQNYNWGVILATGDLSFTGNLVFSGFVYTQGNLFTAGTVVFSGGLYAYSINPNQVSQVDSLGNFSICAGSAAALPQSPLFYNFKIISWQDVPANQP